MTGVQTCAFRSGLPACAGAYSAIWGEGVAVDVLPRGAFYEHVVGTAVVVVSGETAKDSSVILRKGALG